MSDISSPEASWIDAREPDFFGLIRRRVVVSIGATVGWLCAVLLFFAFGSGSFTLFQDIVIVVVSLLVLGGVLLAAWISFGMRFIGRWN